MNNLQVLEHNSERILTTQQLAESYGTDSKVISYNFNNNKSRYQEGKHYHLLENDNLKAFREIHDLPPNLNKLYLWTEKGALLHAKSLNTDKAWEVYDMLVETYFNAKETHAKLEGLSPQLQLLINIELMQKEQEQHIKAIDSKVDNIREIVALSPTQWRDETGALINKMARNLGGNEHIRAIRDESYGLLEQRFRVKLKTRLGNMQKTQALNGVCKSQRDKLNCLDVIGSDNKLIHGYISIVKELAIKYGIEV